MSTNIHSTAIIDPKAELGEDVVIGPYCVVEANTRIGDRSILEPFSLIRQYTEMGAENHIHPHASVGGDPQHIAYSGEQTWLRIGDKNKIRESVTIHRGTVQGHGETVVGSNCLFMAYAHIAHDCIIGDDVIMANSVNLAGHVEVGKKVIISGMSAVQQFVKIGDYAFLGGASGYKQDVPPYMLAHGVRGALYGPNLIGLRRNGFSADTCKALKKAYKTIFRSGQTKKNALEQVETEFGSIPEVMTLLTFIRESKNGVTPAANKNGAED